MSITEIGIKIMGFVLAFVGFCLILSAVGLPVFGIALSPWYFAVLVGFILMGAGIYIVRGGTLSA